MKMDIIKSIMGKVSGNQKDELQEEWIEIKYSLDELDNIKIVEAVKSSL